MPFRRTASVNKRLTPTAWPWRSSDDLATKVADRHVNDRPRRRNSDETRATIANINSTPPAPPPTTTNLNEESSSNRDNRASHLTEKVAIGLTGVTYAAGFDWRDADVH